MPALSGPTTASTVLWTWQAWRRVGAHSWDSWRGREPLYSSDGGLYVVVVLRLDHGGMVVRPYPGGQARLLHPGPCVNIRPATAPFEPPFHSSACSSAWNNPPGGIPGPFGCGTRKEAPGAPYGRISHLTQPGVHPTQCGAAPGPMRRPAPFQDLTRRFYWVKWPSQGSVSPPRPF